MQKAGRGRLCECELHGICEAACDSGLYLGYQTQVCNCQSGWATSTKPHPVILVSDLSLTE